MIQSKYDADEVMAAFERHEYAQVLKMALPFAEEGDSRAQCMISLLHQCGFGVERNFAEAERWLLLAAEQNDPVAWNNLGTLYVVAGKNLPQEPGRARECWVRAKELGFDCGAPYPPPE